MINDAGDGPLSLRCHLAAYFGLAPATRSSGTSIRGEQPSRRGNKQFKRSLFLLRDGTFYEPQPTPTT